MTADELWTMIVKKNPKAGTTGLNLTANGLEKLVRDAYSIGERHAELQALNREAMQRGPGPGGQRGVRPGDVLGDLFNF